MNIEKIDALFYEKRTQHHCGSKIATKYSKVLSEVHKRSTRSISSTKRNTMPKVRNSGNLSN